MPEIEAYALRWNLQANQGEVRLRMGSSNESLVLGAEEFNAVATILLAHGRSRLSNNILETVRLPN